MLTLPIPHSLTHADPRQGAAPVTPWILAAAAGLTLHVAVLAVGSEWTSAEVTVVIGAIVTGVTAIIAAIVGGAIKILNVLAAMRNETQAGVKAAQDVASKAVTNTATAVTKATTEAVNKAVENSQIPTNDAQADVMADRLVKALERRYATTPPAAEPLKVQT